MSSILKEDYSLTITNDPKKPYNLIIEGDNLSVLVKLLPEYREKIDVIYIDPPYNTGVTNLKYNNNYDNWLSFMNKRLQVAKLLLKEDGVLICAIDKNEQIHLGVLLNKIFNNHEIHCITIVHNPRGTQGKNFSYTHEYAFFVLPQNKKVIGNKKLNKDEIQWSNFRNWGSESLRNDAKNCFYPVIVDPITLNIIDFGDVVDNRTYINKRIVNKNNFLYIYPVDNTNIERKWRYARQSVEKVKHLLRCVKSKNEYEIQIGKDFCTHKTVWIDKRYDANLYGTRLLKSIIPNCNFDFPKSIYTVYDCLYAACGTNKNAIVLDFFAGSGTTGHAVLELNKEDDGNRQFILCNDDENNICKDITYQRMKKVIEGFADKDGIPANIRYFRLINGT
jgi:adenine-specific DNA-methyltransferase